MKSYRDGKLTSGSQELGGERVDYREGILEWWWDIQVQVFFKTHRNVQHKK